MQKFFKEPLIHFVLLGIVIFVVYRWVDLESVDSDYQIVVSQSKVDQLATIFSKTWQRAPTADELKNIVDDFVLEEIYYRQAKQIGIDNGDSMIRRRLRQKYEYLTDETITMVAPTDQQLAEFLNANPERFQLPPSYTFQQIYFSSQKRTEAEVTEELSKLKKGEQVGDTSLLPTDFRNAEKGIIDGTLGVGFADQLESLPVGDWSGPVRSGIGWHLVKLETRSPGKVPELATICPIVEREWINDRRLEVRSKVNDELLKKYDITVQWPKKTQQ